MPSSFNIKQFGQSMFKIDRASMTSERASSGKCCKCRTRFTNSRVEYGYDNFPALDMTTYTNRQGVKSQTRTSQQWILSRLKSIAQPGNSYSSVGTSSTFTYQTYQDLLCFARTDNGKWRWIQVFQMRIKTKKNHWAGPRQTMLSIHITNKRMRSIVRNLALPMGFPDSFP